MVLKILWNTVLSQSSNTIAARAKYPLIEGPKLENEVLYVNRVIWVISGYPVELKHERKRKLN